MAAKERTGVVQGSAVELEVYVSGYPTPVSTQITWRRPGGSDIMDSDEGVEFQDDRRRLILSNVQPQQAGLYQCTVTISVPPNRDASAGIQLDVYGECCLNQ